MADKIIDKEAAMAEDPTLRFDKNGHPYHIDPATGMHVNLRPYSSLTEEQKKELHYIGGKASGYRAKLKKKQKDILLSILALPEQDEKRRKILIERLGLDGNYADSVNFAAIKKAASGDIEAARYIRDTIGEKPREGVEIGNLDDKPLQTIDLTAMSDEELMALAARRGADSLENDKAD